MAKLQVLEEGIATVDFFSIYCTLIKLDNSYLVLFTDQTEYGLGTISMGAPSSIEGTKAESTPFSIFGFKNQILSKLITQMCATQLRAPVLTLSYIKNEKLKPEIISKLAVNSFKDALEKYKKTQESESEKLATKKGHNIDEPERFGF